MSSPGCLLFSSAVSSSFWKDKNVHNHVWNTLKLSLWLSKLSWHFSQKAFRQKLEQKKFLPANSFPRYQNDNHLLQMSRRMTKPTKWHVCPAKTQISLGTRPVFAVRMKKHWALNYPLSAQWRLIRLGGCPGWSVSSLGTHHSVGFVVRRLRYLKFFLL